MTLEQLFGRLNINLDQPVSRLFLLATMKSMLAALTNFQEMLWQKILQLEDNRRVAFSKQMRLILTSRIEGKLRHGDPKSANMGFNVVSHTIEIRTSFSSRP